MKKGKSEIILCVDRSGSMSSIRVDMELGLKTFLDKQKLEPGECTVTLVQFDSEIETVFKNKDIKDIEKIEIHPRGMTALFDGIGTAINKVGERLSKTEEADRPESIFFIVISDGMENASREYQGPKIKEMIKHQEDKYSWKFIYLGANQDAFATGQNYGFGAATSMSYGANSVGIASSMGILASGVACMRANSELTRSYAFSADERKEAMGEQIV